ncbi:Fic family protein [Candidatus Woesearchaeota archaeon]|nr:Fic family protein [Candidatus Woesearchaeota archaeon]
MPYIRTRRKGKYLYKELVETVYENGKPVQKFVKHLGKAEAYPIASVLEKEALENLEKIKEEKRVELQKMPKSIKEKFLQDFIIKFTNDTNRIEGSTLTLQDTSLILKDKLVPKGASIKEVKEVENHEKAFDFMYAYEGDISVEFILKMHAILLQNIDDEIAGKLRDFNVVISGSVFKPVPHELVDFEIKEFLSWYDKAKKKLHAFEIAGLVHLYLVTIHPFGDGNGRMSRLLMNFILKRHGYPMLNILYKEREEYYETLQECQLKKIQKPFLKYLFKEYKKQCT